MLRPNSSNTPCRPARTRPPGTLRRGPGLLLLSVLALCLGTPTSAAVFVVTSGADVGDAAPGNGICGAVVGMITVCTLRAAVEEANALPGGDTGTLGGGTFAIGSELDVTDHLGITGQGPRATTVRAATGVATRLFDVEAGSVFTLSDVTLRGGDAGFFYGGAIHADGSLLVDRVWFDGNRADTCGAVRAAATTEISNSTFTGNVAEGPGFGGEGGALCVSAGSSTAITNSTFTGNRAKNGAAILISHPSSFLFIASSTIAGNVDVEPTPLDSSAIHHLDAASLALHQSIIYGTCEYGEEADISSLGGNREGPGHGCTIGAPDDLADLTALDLALGSLGDYGGPVPTMLPGLASLAVDPGTTALICSQFDARGEPRVASCDVGAVERQPDDVDSGPVFVDDFESGTTDAWSFVVPMP